VADVLGRLSPAAWRRLEPTLDRALELSPLERPRFLEEACGGDPSLRADLEALLAAHHATGGLLDAFAPERAAALFDEETDADPAPERVGPYRVVREIGRGGMGAVYLAERADGQFERQVAVKLIKRGMDSAEVVGRFVQERRILGRLQHPRIARLLDGGVAEDGRPYLVMEYVEGRPVTAYCEARRLGTDERLALFDAVCDPVQYAHRNLVVHRDLKPGNVFVSDAGEVRLLDFGIAKMLDPEEPGIETRTAARALTPEYAAPEQIRGEPATTATDVYGLGVVLYEMLTGRRPHDRAGTSVAQITNAVLNVAPPSPSSVAGAEKLRKRLLGDLDTIVLAALEKDPARRYPSVEALREDVQRHRRLLPVLARRPTLLYRARRFVSRHRAAVVAASLAGLALASAFTLALWQAHVASSQARRAEEVKAFLASVFRVSRPEEGLGKTLTARELLDVGARRVEAELATEPEVQSEMMTLMGGIYGELGEYARGEGLVRRALELRRTHGEGDLRIADSLDALGVLLRLEGRFEPAEASAREALAILERRHGPEHPSVAKGLDHLGAILYLQARYDEAERTFGRSLRSKRRLLGPAHPEVADTLDGLARAINAAGRLPEAEGLYREALALRMKALGPEHPAVSESLSDLATVLFEAGRYADAESLYVRALAISRRVLGPEHPETIADLSNLGIALSQQNRLEEAEPLLREALALKTRRLGERHPDTAPTVAALALCLHRQGRLPEAEELYGRALSIVEERLGPEHHDVAKNLHDLATVLKEEGQLDRAETLLRRCLAILRKGLGADHPHVGRAMASLADVLLEKGDLAGAEATYKGALLILRDKLPPGHPITAGALLGLGRVYLRETRPAAAEPLLREAHDALRTSLGSSDASAGRAAAVLAECLVSLSRGSEAEALLREARDTSAAATRARHASAR
jgi:tetratricopeptide (TPR) repeat protein